MALTTGGGSRCVCLSLSSRSASNGGAIRLAYKPIRPHTTGIFFCPRTRFVSRDADQPQPKLAVRFHDGGEKSACLHCPLSTLPVGPRPRLEANEDFNTPGILSQRVRYIQGVSLSGRRLQSPCSPPATSLDKPLRALRCASLRCVCHHHIRPGRRDKYCDRRPLGRRTWHS